MGALPPDRGISTAAADGGPPADSELAARLRLTINRLARLLRSLGPPADLSPSLTSALVTIEREGPLTLGQLSAIERVTPPSITRAAASLQRLGLARREVDKEDRRVARLSITSEGQRALQRLRTQKTAYLARKLSRLDESELSLLSEALPVLERLLEDHR